MENKYKLKKSDVNSFAQGLRLDLQRVFFYFFFFYLYEIQKMKWIRKEKVTILWGLIGRDLVQSLNVFGWRMMV